MKNKLHKRIRFNAENGSAATRLKAIQEGKHVCEEDSKRLKAKGHRQCQDYTRQFEASTSQPADGLLRPTAIPSEIRDARMTSFIAWALVIVELLLALFLALTFTIAPFFVIAVTMAAIFVVKVSLLLIWRSPERPQATRRELRNVILIPSFIVTIVSLAVLSLARGPLALILFPLIGLSLGLLSLGICFLSAGLMAFAYSLNWSKKAEKEYNATAKEHAATVQLWEALSEMGDQLKPKPVPATINQSQYETALIVPLQDSTDLAVRKEKESTVAADVFKCLLVLITVIWLTGCQSSSLTNFRATSDTAQAVNQSSPETCDLAIYSDWSLSGKAQTLQQASQNIVTALPEIAEKYNVNRLAAYHFGADGWDAEPIAVLSLPIFQMAASDETEALIGLVRAEHEKKARQDYQAKLRQKLAALTAEMLIPANVPEPKCTDIQGVLNRITKTQHRQISIVITDGAENCASALKTVKVTQPLVIVLLSEQDTASELSHEQYEERYQQLAAVASHAVIIPHFETQLLNAVNQAVANVKTKP